MGGLFSKSQPPPPPPQQQQQQPAAKPLVLTDLQRAKFELKVKKESLERMTKTQSMESAVRGAWGRQARCGRRAPPPRSRQRSALGSHPASHTTALHDSAYRHPPPLPPLQNSHERMRAAMQAGDTALARRYAALVLAKRKLRETTLGHITRLEGMVRCSRRLLHA